MIQLKNIAHGFDLEIGEIGVTIRKGKKWAEYVSSHLQSGIELWECPAAHENECNDISCKYRGQGKILGYWEGQWQDLPLGLIKLEHNKSARDFAVLKQMLIRAYGDINDFDHVTALIYLRVSKK